METGPTYSEKSCPSSCVFNNCCYGSILDPSPSSNKLAADVPGKPQLTTDTEQLYTALKKSITATSEVLSTVLLFDTSRPHAIFKIAWAVSNPYQPLTECLAGQLASGHLKHFCVPAGN